MTVQTTTRVIQTRVYLRSAGYRLLSEVMANERTLYNAALEHRRKAYDFHKRRCPTCILNARLDERVRLHKKTCADGDECSTCSDLERRAKAGRISCTAARHRKACAACRSKDSASTALTAHRKDCDVCNSRRCGHKRLVDGCPNCFCETAAPMRESVKTARPCAVWQAASVTKYDQSKELTQIRAADQRMNAVDRRLSVGTLERLEFAFDNFYRRVKLGQAPGYPRFKNAHRFRTVQIYSGANNYLKSYDAETGKGRIQIKGLPTLRFRCRRVPAGQQPKDMKITLKPNGKVWVAMSFEFDCESVSVKRPGDPMPRKTPRAPIGIDMGVNKRATISCGESLPSRDNSEHRRKKRRLMRRLDRQRRAALKDGRARQEPRRRDDGSYVLGKDGRRKFKVVWLDAGGKPGAPSRRYRQTRDQLSRLEMREEVRSRNDLHKWTADIARRHDFIAVEDLSIQNMTRSAAGTLEEPGSRVAQKRGLNRSILEQQWGKALTYLEYKAESAGIPFMRADPKNTSRTCANCGAVEPGARRGESFVCLACGNMDDADHNAARNILARGWLQWQSESGVAEPLPLGSPGSGVCASASTPNRRRLPTTPRSPRASPEHRQLTFAL